MHNVLFLSGRYRRYNRSNDSENPLIFERKLNMAKNKISIKFIAALVSLIMLVSVIPLNVLAAEISLINATQLANEALELSDIEYEMTDKRTEDTKVFQRADGTKVMIQSATPLHYLENGQWKEIDNSLVKEEKDGKVKYKNKSNSFDVSFPEEIGKDDYITMGKNGHTIEFAIKLNDKQSIKNVSSPKNNSSKKKEKTTDPTEIMETQNLTASVEYKGKKNEPSFKYSVLPEGIKEDIVISEVPTSKVSYSFTIKTKLAVTLEQDKNSENYNSVTFADTNGETVFYIPAPFMYDNNETLSEDISVSLLSDKKNTYTIIYTPNLEWLKSEERVYPVIVDPVITISDKSNIIDTFTTSKFGSAIIPKHSLDYAYVQNDGTLCQTFVALDNDDVEALPANVQILSAKLSMVAKNKSGNNNIINAHKITESWNTLTLINSNKPSYESTPLSFATITGTSSGRYTWDITEAFAEWLYDESLSNGVVLDTPSNGQVLLDTKEINDESKRPYFIVEYRESTGVTEDFSYRVLEAGDAGTIYINENTRSFYMERDEIGIGGNNMPVLIKRHYNYWTTFPTDIDSYYLKSCYGTGWSLNYNRFITYISGSTPRYRYINDTGAVIYYVNSGVNESGYTVWEEEVFNGLVGTGSKLLIPSNSGTTNYTAMKVVSKDNYIDNFDSLGRLVKITDGDTDGTCSINIYYVGSSMLQIDKIVDGAGREYRFTYKSASLVDGLLTTISCHNANGTQITMPNGSSTVPLQMSYTYSGFMDGSISTYNLEQVTYPNNAKCTYMYDVFGNVYLVRDERKYYSYTFLYDLSQKIEEVRVTDASTYPTYEETLYIEQQGPTQTILTTNSGYSEIRTFDYESGQNTGFIDSDGKYVGRHYATMFINDYVLEKIPTGFSLASPENNLVTNASFNYSSGNRPTNWQFSGLSSSDILVSENILGESVRAMKVTGSQTSTKSISQTVSINAEKGDSLVVAGLSKAPGAQYDAAKGSLHYIKVSFVENINGTNTSKVVNIPFAPNSEGWQICSELIDFNGTCSSVTVSFVYANQVNPAYFYGMNVSVQGNNALWSGLNTMSNDEDFCPCEDCSTSNCTCRCEGVCVCAECQYTSSTSVNTKNNTDNGTISAGPNVSMKTTKTYTSNGNYLKSETDVNGRTFTYNVDEGNGLVTSTQVGDMVTNYTYDAVGTLREINQVVSGLTNGNEMSLELKSELGYNYDTIYHNGTPYSFSYDKDGQLKGIVVGRSRLADYSYTASSNINKITYGNYHEISYTYSNDRVQSVLYNGAVKYTYGYDADGNLVSISDVDSGWITTYDENGYTITSTLDNSIIYETSKNDATETDSYFGIDFTNTTLDGEMNSANATKTSSSQTTTDFGTVVFSNTTDHYDRTVEKSAEFTVNYSDEQGNYTGNIDVSTNIGYKTLETGYSTMLPENYEYSLSINQNESVSKFKYDYDELGNIVQISEVSANGSVTPISKYQYDAANQLIREDNLYMNESNVYSYDVGGNMVTKNTYNFTFGNLGEVVNSITYSYEPYTYASEGWADQVISYNGTSLSYDGIGNLQYHYGNSPLTGSLNLGLVWEAQELQYAYDRNNSSHSFDFEYDADGYRTKKKEYTGNGFPTISTDYIWKDGLLRAKRIDDNYLYEEITITYLYDTNGMVYGFKSSDEKYPFIYKKNQQGDVISIVSSETGNTVLNYYYDAWGNVKLGYPSQNNADIEFANKIAKYNDFTYRSYCFDIETGLYYLHNRYYSPTLSRFISADKYCATEISPLGFNMYLYCQNNPVNNIDDNGTSQTSIMSTALGRGLGFYDDPEDENAKGFLGFTHLGDSFFTWTSKPWSTVLNGWQSHFGYMDFFDTSAPLAGCHIHYLKSEFEYENRDWRVELWMGRYGISLGAEIGIYKDEYTLPFTSVELKGWYKCSTVDLYEMFFILCKTQKTEDGIVLAEPFLVRSTEGHWWLTGFLANITDIDIDYYGFLDFKPYGVLRPKNMYMLSWINFADPNIPQLFVDGIDNKYSMGYNETIVLYNKSENNEQNKPSGSVMVFWSTEEIPEGYPPKINLFDLLYNLIITYN